MTQDGELNAMDTIVVRREVVERHILWYGSRATVFVRGVRFPDAQPEFVTSVCSVIGKLAKRFFIGADRRGIGRPRWVIVQVVPETIGPRGSSCIANERVSRVRDPKGCRDLVCVEQGGRASRKDAKVTKVTVVGLYSILLEWEWKILMLLCNQVNIYPYLHHNQKCAYSYVMYYPYPSYHKERVSSDVIGHVSLHQ